ncbi:MAG: bifunctional phosphoribosylaminoimidazolecarboxamide formyltransferase/IMP cyclohydrolase, partial [Myxococcales bacterium]|nr:bifunctional phosphoribosylaminoimidazolecarboxamide formyltransferase/IMP cyclohydrolase [Myxococcales bacterium]
PKIHGGILALPRPDHEEQLREHNIAPIDLVVVNLYPFREVTRRPNCSFDDAIENIDIGGPTMVRAAAKSWQRVAVVVEPGDYGMLAAALREHGFTVPESLRRALARKAFAHTAAYDAAIATYLAGVDDDGGALPAELLPAELFISAASESELRYGENPHQRARFYRTSYAEREPSGLDRAIQHQGKPLSYNNLLDADGALGLIRDLQPHGTAAVVMKHVSPCGACCVAPSSGVSLAEVFARAREADAESAFGGIVALTGEVDDEVAARLAETFLEVVIAPAYSEGARKLLRRKKKHLRLLELPDMFSGAGVTPLRLRSVAGGLLAQREDVVGVRVADGRVVTRRAPTPEELADLELAQIVGKSVRSNAIVFVRGGVTVGIGGGQTSRVEASRQAARRAGELAKGSVLASDAFFPFRDGVDAAAAAGVTAIVEPGGSVRDDEVIAAADEHGIAMVFTGERHFRH